MCDFFNVEYLQFLELLKMIFENLHLKKKTYEGVDGGWN